MRSHHAWAAGFLAVVGVLTPSMTGQVDVPLPRVVARAIPQAISPQSEATSALSPAGAPEADASTRLAAAVRGNDWLTFDTLYREARDRGADVRPFAPLHEIWHYAVTDPIGGFYGSDLHTRLASAYPGFSTFIAEYVIIDGNGNPFYPTSETRAYLLDRAVEGTLPAPGFESLLTPAETSPQPAATIAETPVVAAGVAPRVTPRIRRKSERPAAASAVRPQPAVVNTPVASEPVTAVNPLESASSQVPAPSAATPLATPPSATAAAPIDAIAPRVARSVPAPQPAQEPAQGKGLLLIVTGLLTVAFASMILYLQKPHALSSAKGEPVVGSSPVNPDEPRPASGLRG